MSILIAILLSILLSRVVPMNVYIIQDFHNRILNLILKAILK